MNKYLEINNNTRVTTDAHQFIIQKSRKIEAKDSKNYGSIVWDTDSYHPTLNLVVKKLLKDISIDHFPNLISINNKMNEIKRWADKELFTSSKEL